MEIKTLICQSCGMPLDKDPQKGGTNFDKSISDKYCSFCFQDGKFVDDGITLEQKIAKNIQMAVNMGMTKDYAKQISESILPKLERWK
ncbi:MAG: zinc ribbon domain-containing protein [Saprospiraceae bacterium]|jgi:hypothetical protein|nr:zinc ribbon domain-containing protein [Saprospiraceae bacterium]